MTSQLPVPADVAVQSPPEETYRVLFTGRRGVGKSTIVQHLLHRDGIEYDGSLEEEEKGHDAYSCCLRHRNRSLAVDRSEALVVLNDLTTNENDDDDDGGGNDVTANVIVYSVEDRKSYELAVDLLYEIHNDETGRQVSVVLVANKVDLVRTRVVSEQEGKSTAKTYDCKYIEVSAAIDHQIDDLYLGILRQLRCVFSSPSSSSRRRFPPPSKSRPSSPTRRPRWGRDDSLEHRQNSDSCCLLAAREKVLARIFAGQRRTSKSCINLFETQ